MSRYGQLTPNGRAWVPFTAAVLVAISGFGAAPLRVNAATDPAPLAGTHRFLITPTTLVFGSEAIGTTSPVQQVTITNVSGSSVVGNPEGGALSPPFNDSQNCEGVTLAPGGSCVFDYWFAPSATGSFSATSSVDFDGQNFAIKVSGSATDQFLVTPTTLVFGSEAIGTTSPVQQVTITNVSGSSVVGNPEGGALSPPFNDSQNCEGVTLAPGGSCVFDYWFAPSATGSFSATSSVDFDGQNFAIKVSGKGTHAT